MGKADNNMNFLASASAVVYNPTNEDCFVVWQGDDDTAPLVNNEFEIFSSGLSSGCNDLLQDSARISDMGTDGNTAFRAGGPAVAYNSTDNQYLVVWQGDDNTAPLVDGEFEIFGQLLNVDTDNDDMVNASDNCPNVANPAQTDTDGNGIGDACEPVPATSPSGAGSSGGCGCIVLNTQANGTKKAPYFIFCITLGLLLYRRHASQYKQTSRS